MRRRLLPILVGLAVWANPLGAASACADAHIVMFFDAFPAEAASLPFYWTVEGTGGPEDVRFRVRLFGGDCNGNPISSTLRTDAGTATAVADYTPQQGEVVFPNTGTHDDFQDFVLPVTGDVLLEGMETASLVLSNPKGGAALAHPSTATVLMLDDEGPPQIGLVDGAYRHVEHRPGGGVPVFRSGNLLTATTVNYTIAPEGPNPATPGADFGGGPSGTLNFSPGQRVQMIPIATVRDGVTEPDEGLRVTISGAEVTGTSSVGFSIVDAGAGGPASSLHHPRQKVRYRAEDFRIREIHIFTRATGGLDVTAAQFALRRNMKGGRCAWLKGKRFRKGPCNKERWLSTRRYEPDFFYYRMRGTLPPTGGRVRSYTAFSRAIDRAGQFEVALEKGRNANTFKIRRGKK